MAKALIDGSINSILIKHPGLYGWIMYCVERGNDGGPELVSVYSPRGLTAQVSYQHK